MLRSRKASESETCSHTTTNSKRFRNAALEEEEMRQLEKIVLSKDTDLIEKLNKSQEEDSETVLNHDGEDGDFAEESSDYESAEEGEKEVEKDFWSKHDEKWVGDGEVDVLIHNKNFVTLDDVKKKLESKKAAWNDPSDDVDAGEVYVRAKRLPRQVDPSESYKSIQERKFYGHKKAPKWASGLKEKKVRAPDDSSDDEEEVGLLQTAGNLIIQSKRIPKNNLSFKKCLPINKGHKRSEIYSNVTFHPTQEVAITSTNHHLDIFKMENSGNANTDLLLKTYQFDHFDIEKVKMTVDSNELILGSCHSRGRFYTIDIESGTTSTHPLVRDGDKLSLRRFVLSDDGQYIACRSNGGYCHLLTSETKEIIHSFHVSGECGPLAFSPNSAQLYMCGYYGQVYVWDIASKKCLHKFTDEGSFKTTAMAIATDGQFLVCGSETGVVNIYELSSVVKSNEPKPIKSIMNLTTAVTGLTFNPTSELLAIYSWNKLNAVKIVHMESLSVYSNFPIASINYKKIADVAFSPNSGYLSFSGSSQFVNLFRLPHYSSY